MAGGQRHVPAALLPGMTVYLLYRRLREPQSWSGRVGKPRLHRYRKCEQSAHILSSEKYTSELTAISLDKADKSRITSLFYNIGELSPRPELRTLVAYRPYELCPDCC